MLFQFMTARFFTRFKTIALLLLLYSCSSGNELPEGYPTIETFIEAYTTALKNRDTEKLKSLYTTPSYTCYLDRFDFEGAMTTHTIENITPLQGDKLDHFHLTWNSELAKVELFHKIKASHPDISDNEIMQRVFKTLLSPDFVRSDLTYSDHPDTQVRLTINSQEYTPNHPCFLQPSLSELLFLKKTRKGYLAVEPQCDIMTTTGLPRYQKTANTSIDQLFLKLSSVDIEKYVDSYKTQRTTTFNLIMSEHNITYSDAKYLVEKKICPSL